MALLFILLANLPDLDVIPGMFLGKAQLFHRSFTHSFFASLIFAALTAGLLKYWKQTSFAKIFWLTFAAYFSHVLLDALTGYVRFMFWPFKISFHPILFPQILDQTHSVTQCQNMGQFCALMTSRSVALRLGVETLLVFVISRVARVFPRYRILHSGISESPALITGLALFLFFLTAFFVTGQAGG